MVVWHVSHCRYILEQETSQRDVAVIQHSRIQHQRERALLHVMCTSVFLSAPALIKSPCPFKYSIRLTLVRAHVINKLTCWGWKAQIIGFCQPHCAQITFQSVVAGKFALSGFPYIRAQLQVHMSTIDSCVWVCEHVRAYVDGSMCEESATS